MGRSKSQRKNQRAKKSSSAQRAFPLNLNQAVISLNKTHSLGERERQLDLAVQFSGSVRIGGEQGPGLAAGTYADWQLAVPDLTPGLYAQFIQSVSPSSRRRVRADGAAAMREELQWFAEQHAPHAVAPLQQPAQEDFGMLPDFNAGLFQNAVGNGLGAGLGTSAAQLQDFQMPPPAYVPNPFNDQQAFQAPVAATQDFGTFPQQNSVNFNGAGAGAPLLSAQQHWYQDDIPSYDNAFVNQAISDYTPPADDGRIGGAVQPARVDHYQGNMNAQPYLGHQANAPFSDAAFGTSGRVSPPVGQSDMAVSTPSHNGFVPSIAMSSSSFQEEYVPPVGDDFEQTVAGLWSDDSMLMNPQRFPSPVYDPVPGPSRIPFDQKVNNWMGEIPMSTFSGPVTPPVSTPESSSGSSLLSEVWSANTSTDFESSLGGSFILSRGTSPATSEDVVRGLLSGPSEADVSLKSPSPLPIRQDVSAIGSYRDIDEDSAAGMTPASFSIYETGLEKDLNPEMFAAIENDRSPSPCPPSPQYDPFTMDSLHF